MGIYILLSFRSDLDAELAFPAHHFYIVSITSLVALFIAIVVGIVGLRQRNLQVIYVSLAFVSLASFFSAHGLATPGFLIANFTPVVGIAAQLSVFTMSLWLMVSSLATNNGISNWLSKRANALFLIYTPAVIAVNIMALNDPRLVEFIPVDQAPLRYFVGGITLLAASIAGGRYWQSYRYSRFPFQLSIAYVGGWIAVSQIIITTGQTFFLSWWLYHFLLLCAMIVTVAGLVTQYRRGDSIARSILGLFSADPQERLQSGISPSARALIEATEARDPYIAGHSVRVASGAFELGSALRLPPEDLRALVQGGVMHDVGKLQVPDEILNKPGPLSPEERKQIESHTEAGYELCARLGFMAPELAVIRSHHERIDGKGYPDGIAGGQIPLYVQILSVVDVYDALTTARAYRPAWSEAEALNYLKENRRTQFEARLVDAWVTLRGKAAG